MKILFVQDSLGTGGAERSNADLWYFLRANNIQITIAVLEHRKVGIEHEILEAGFDVHFLEGGIIRQVRSLNVLIKDFQPDIVHSVLFRATLRVRFVKFLRRFILVESLVNCMYSEVRFQDPKVNGPLLWLYKHIDRLTSGKTDKFIAITQEVKDHYQSALGIAAEKITVIHRGRNKNPFINQRESVRQQLRTELNLHHEEIIFVHVGRQEFQKGHLVLLKAIKQIETELNGANVTFLMCGRDGNSTGSIQTFLSDHPVDANILWLGHRHDIPRILAGADVFLFPSLYEGLGGALIEAKAAALPVICSDIPVFSEIVVDDVDALRFPSGDASQFGKRIIDIIHDPAKRTQMGKNSELDYLRRFQIEHINGQMLTFYKSILA